MNENLYEIIGRKQADLEALNTEYDKLLGVLSQVISGEIEAQRVSVDLQARSWSVNPKKATVIPLSIAEPADPMEPHA